MWQYRIKPTLRITSLVKDGKTFRVDGWTSSEERLKSAWHRSYLIEKEVKPVVKEELVIEASSVIEPVVTTTKRKSS